MGESFPLLHDPPGQNAPVPWYQEIPIFGPHFFGYWRQLAIEMELEQQAIDRGPVPESEWELYEYSESVRRTIEEIVLECAYPKGSTFHPLDPIELMFVLRYGDLNEQEILIGIDRKLGFKVDYPLACRLIAERTTFIEFIRMVEENARAS
jgi:hypothetical protein